MRSVLQPRLLIGPAVLAMAWVMLAFVPARSELSDASDRSLSAQQDRLDAEDALEAARTFVADRAMMEPRFQNLADALPTHADLGTFTRAVEQMARASSVSVEVVSPTVIGLDEDLDVPPGVAAVSVSISTTGSYSSIAGFIQRLESGERLVLIDAISMTTDPADPTLLNTDLEMRIFAASSDFAGPEVDDEEDFDE